VGKTSAAQFLVSSQQPERLANTDVQNRGCRDDCPLSRKHLTQNRNTRQITLAHPDQVHPLNMTFQKRRTMTFLLGDYRIGTYKSSYGK
jgi:hypothetical protein